MTPIRNIDEFQAAIAGIQTERPSYRHPAAFAVGLEILSGGAPVAYRFPAPNCGNTSVGTAAVLAQLVGYTDQANLIAYPSQGALARVLEDYFGWCEKNFARHANVYTLQWVTDMCQANEDVRPVMVFVSDLSKPPLTAADVYFRLHLLSHRLVKPGEVNLDGLFGLLPNVAWTSEGPMAIEVVEARRMDLLLEGRHLHVHAVDKIPHMTDFYVPPGVRIHNTATVRLGAYIGTGATIMYAGGVNANAGVAGEGNMIEGRVPFKTFVGAASDLGGGASIAGTLSGGGTEIIEIGEHCLIGANAGCGISLGDRCTIAAGLYVSPTLKVLDMRDPVEGDDTVGIGARCPALDFKGQNDLLFVIGTRTGRPEVRTNRHPNKPNVALHTKQ